MRKVLLTLLMFLLCACGTQENTTVNKIAMSSEEMLAKIHANNIVNNELVFQAMPDEALLDLRDKAMQAQTDGNFDLAKTLLNQALAINEKDPEILQMLAELALLQKSFANAERFATNSYHTGPKLGGLCRRNWLTIHYAKSAQGLPIVQEQLAKHLAECTVVPAARM
jgi:hypothetical protein